jgi:hypothetical protein
MASRENSLGLDNTDLMEFAVRTDFASRRARSTSAALKPPWRTTVVLVAEALRGAACRGIGMPIHTCAVASKILSELLHRLAGVVDAVRAIIPSLKEA